MQLVARNVNIWLDRWELSLGDSLIEKVQGAVDGASALLVILSKASTGRTAQGQGQVFNFDFNSVLTPIRSPMSRYMQLITENINMGAGPRILENGK